MWGRFQPFVQNAWSLLDTFIVAMSVMSLIVTNQVCVCACVRACVCVCVCA